MDTGKFLKKYSEIFFGKKMKRKLKMQFTELCFWFIERYKYKCLDFCTI